MATLTATSSKWNVGKDTSKLSVDPRASVSTWSSTRYTPSVITFNANWAPAPLSAPAPLQSFSSSAASSSGASPRWCPAPKPYLLRTERPGPSSVPAEALDSDDGERVSHLDFDSDSDDDNNGVENKDEGRRRRRVRYGWHGMLGGSAGEQEDSYGYEREDEGSTEPTPTQERTNFAAFLRPSSRNTDYNAPLRAYLASYGFPDGLGYEHPPPDISYRSSTPSSRYSFHGESKAEDGSGNANNNFAHDDSNSKIVCSYQHCQPGSVEHPPSGPRSAPLLAPSAWPTFLNASNTLLTSLELDSTLVDDPCTAWEALCWDEAAPDSGSDSETDPGSRGDDQEKQRSESRIERRHGVRHELTSENRDEAGLVHRPQEKADEESWRESSPSPVFRRRDELTETDSDTEDEGDDRTISNATWNEAATTSPGTSTISTEDPEEWISLTGARAQAARARILPYRHLQVPLPTYPQTDASALATSADTGRTERTPVDPVLAQTPPVLQPAAAHDEVGVPDVLNEPARVARDLCEMLANTSGEGAAEDETAPDYGECERDRLVITERDPPPYDLAYDSSHTLRLEDRTGSDHGVAPEGNQPGGHGISSSSSSQSQLRSQPQVFTQVPTTRIRSQLTFPTSPTETDSIPAASMSPTSAFSSQPTPLFSASPISPATTDTTALITPAATQFSASYSHPYRDSSQYSNVASSSKFLSQFPHVAVSYGSGNESRPNSPPYLFPQGSCTVYPSPQNQMGTNQRPRPLPPRPTGPGSGFGSGGTRTTAEAWLSASAAGPYAVGSTPNFGSMSSPTSPASRSRVGVWNAFGYGSGATTSVDSGLRTSPESRSPPPAVGVGPTSRGGDGGVDHSGWSTPLRRSDENSISGEPTAPQRSLSERPTHYNHHRHHHLQQHHYPYALNLSSAVSERSLSTESFVVLDDSDSDQDNDKEKDDSGMNEQSFGSSHTHSINLRPANEDEREDKLKGIDRDAEEEEKEGKHPLGFFHSSSETAFQIITSRTRSEVDGGIGKIPTPISSHHPHLHHIRHAQSRSWSQRGNKGRNREGNGGGSGSGKALQRLATRCSTLTRRIGIVTGVGGAGRDR